jgi:dTDP-4-dehydrorhamnose 3,5-epimerase
MLEQASQAPATVTERWEAIGQRGIEGVEVHEIKNVVFRNGVLTELFRDEWFDPKLNVRHIVHVSMLPGTTSTWHCHKRQRDIIFPVQGQFRIGLYDDRRGSPTYRSSMVVNAGIVRPSYYLVPPGVWHALKNPTSETSTYVVINDEPYVYNDPDDWILPVGAEAIPCKLD